MRKQSILFLSVMLLVVFSSCKKETNMANNLEDPSIKLTSLVEKVKAWHDSVLFVSNKSNVSELSKIKVQSVSSGLDNIIPPVIDWDKAFINFDSTTTKSLTVPLSIDFYTGKCLQLVATARNDSTNGYFIQTIPDSVYYASSKDLFDYSNFTGSVLVYNLSGRCLAKTIFNSGHTVSSIKPNQSTSSQTIVKAFADDIHVLPEVIVFNTPYYSGSTVVRVGGFSSISVYPTYYSGTYGSGGNVVAGGGGPLYRFPKNENYETKYPKLATLVKNIYQTCLANPKLLNCLKSYSHMSDAQLYNALQYGQGPTIVVKDINTNWNGTTRSGYFLASENPNIINLDVTFVQDYEKGIGIDDASLSLFLSVTLLHELVHYGNNMNDFSEGPIDDYGTGWETCVYGMHIDDVRGARIYLQKKH